MVFVANRLVTFGLRTQEKRLWRSHAATPRFPLDSPATRFLQAFMKTSMSRSVLAGPRLARTAPTASPAATFMAASTGEPATLPEEQAEPEDTATPARSSAISAVSALTPGTANIVVLGSRSASAPKTTASGDTSLSKGFETIPQLGHMPPGRHKRLCRRLRRRAEPGDADHVLGPPAAAAFLAATLEQGIADMHRFGSLHQCADAFGSAQLVGGNGDKIGAERVEIAIDLSGALDGVDMQEPARLMDDVGCGRVSAE